MIYVMSDIHGYEGYFEMLKRIEFSDDDFLYVLGDVLDRGAEPVKILQDMSMRANVIPIAGNHEIMALDVLSDLLVEVTEDNYNTHVTAEMLHKLLQWQQNGGDVTLRQFRQLPKEERFFLLEYLQEFSPYETVRVNGKTFVLTHSGNLSAEKPLSKHSLEELAFSGANYKKQIFSDPSVYCVSGHTPTLSITGKAEIYHCNHHINIDCGAVFGGRLACLRLDDFQEFYC